MAQFEALKSEGSIPNTPLIQVSQWAALMREVIKIRVYWERWQPELIGADADGQVDFNKFLQLAVLHLSVLDKEQGQTRSVAAEQLTKSCECEQWAVVVRGLAVVVLVKGLQCCC